MTSCWFDKAAGTKWKALESQQLLTVLFYTALPSGRAKEFHTLHYRIHTTIPQPTVDPRCPIASTSLEMARRLTALFLVIPSPPLHTHTVKALMSFDHYFNSAA